MLSAAAVGCRGLPWLPVSTVRRGVGAVGVGLLPPGGSAYAQYPPHEACKYRACPCGNMAPTPRGVARLRDSIARPARQRQMGPRKPATGQGLLTGGTPEHASVPAMFAQGLPGEAAAADTGTWPARLHAGCLWK